MQMLCGICSRVASCVLCQGNQRIMCCNHAAVEAKQVVRYHGMSVASLLVWLKLQSLLELAANEVSSDSCKQDERLQKIYSNTLEHIKAQQGGEGEVGQRYEAIKV